MHTDPIIPTLTMVLVGLFLLGIIFRRLRQPYVVGYLVAGIIVGPSGIGLIEDEKILHHLGSIGVLLLLFFVGMELSPIHLISGWRISLVGTVLQILASIGCVSLIGLLKGWPTSRILLLGFVISLSSTSVIMKILNDWKESATNVGKDVIGILIVQDILIIPMLIILGFFSGETFHVSDLILQCVGGLVVIMVTIIIIRLKGKFHLPFGNQIQNDREMQLFLAAALCFGIAFIASLFKLPTALGALLGGMIVASAKETDWIHHSLEPFHIVFMACFFVSIGMMVDVKFIAQYIVSICLLVTAAYVTNLFINALILRILGRSTKESLYAGVLLSQIGEFSFVLAAVGLSSNIISDFGYQMTIAVISTTLLLSPACIILARRFQLHQSS